MTHNSHNNNNDKKFLIPKVQSEYKYKKLELTPCAFRITVLDKHGLQNTNDSYIKMHDVSNHIIQDGLNTHTHRRTEKHRLKRQSLQSVAGYLMIHREYLNIMHCPWIAFKI